MGGLRPLRESTLGLSSGDRRTEGRSHAQIDLWHESDPGRIPNATPAKIEFARNWRDPPKVVFSSTIDKVDWNTRLVRRDAIAEIARLKPEDGGPMRAGGATLAAATNFDEL